MSARVFHRVVRVAALAVPASRRDQMLEQWLADLNGCAELGIPRHQIALGVIVSLLIYRPEPTETRTFGMNERTKHKLRLALYAVWIAAATVWVWIFGTHLAVSGTNLGFALPNGTIADITVVLLVAGIVVGVLGVVFGYRSIRAFATIAER